ncbi:MAG: tetratricopeptide repeat protein [Chlamydiae bacterium]|nr:tetratricopeptide repeat protein [Chlamydiota bacterium]
MRFYSIFIKILLLLCFSSILLAKIDSESKKPSLKTLYNSLDPSSLSQYLAFYKLYPDTEEGQKALTKAWQLLHLNSDQAELDSFPLPKFDIQPIISIVTRQPFEEPPKLATEQINAIEKLSSQFPHRKLKGAQVWKKEELFLLKSDEIDIARAILLYQFEDSPTFQDDIRQYETTLDLMALQILARLNNFSSNEDKIREINRFIFQEMQFRFPPHSLHAKDIDLYTFLPSVLDNRQGVCLGVSILYLCLSQRLDLPLEIITPPGHIYLRYVTSDNQPINIETTARGINLPNEVYLGLNTRILQKRDLKEVVGMVFFNQAAASWHRQDYSKTVSLYEKALPYLNNDPLLHLFLGLNYLFAGKVEEGKRILKPLKNFTFDWAISKETMVEDYLEKKIDIEGLKAIFLPVDENRSSILAKQQTLLKILKKYPQFRAGLLQLAVTYLQIGRTKEALEILEKYHQIDPNDSTVEYYLASICLERLDYQKAWFFLKKSESIVSTKNHYPKALKALRHQLRALSP